MIAKTFEIRDAATFIPVLAVKLEPVTEQDRYLLARAGFGLTREDQAAYVHLIRMDGGSGAAHCDPYDWGNRTMTTAHDYIAKHFNSIESGAVIDVEYIIGLTDRPKRTESETAP